MDGIKTTLTNIGPARLALMMGVLVGLLAFFIYLMTRITAPNMALLYSNLELSESGEILNKLESLGIPTEIKNEGTQIMVPAEQVGRLRMVLAEAGLPSGGSMGYEIFDKSDFLGTSSFVQDVNLVRALEGELARTISTIQGVTGSRVHLVLPKRELFSREKQNASASVFLKTAGAKRLSKVQVQAIRQLVAAAIPGLMPQNISVVDHYGTLLARGDGDDQSFSSASTSDELRRNFEDSLASGLEKLLESALGPNKARVEVSATIDYNKETENSETFSPEGQVVRSAQTLNDNAQSSAAGAGGAQTVQNNLPQGAAPGAGAGGGGNNSQRTSETTNYEISKTTKTLVKEDGRIQRLSVAVLVDGTYKADSGGKKTYTPRPQDELEKIKTLVKSAVGFSADRNDSVEVVTMAFYVPEEPQIEEKKEGFLGFDKAEITHIIEIFVLGIVGILVLFLIIRPILNKILEGPSGGGGGGFSGALPQLGGPSGGGESMGLGSLNLPGGSYATSGGGGMQMSGGSMLPSAPQGMDASATMPLASMGGGGGSPNIIGSAVNSRNNNFVNMQQLDGQLKGSAVKQIEQIVDKHSEEAVSILRSWMHQDE